MTRSMGFPFTSIRFRALAVAVVVTAMSACSGDWLGESEGPPLPGERITVLEHDRRLQPSAGAENVAIRLPAPEPNEDWPQAGGYSHHAMQHMQIGEVPTRRWSASAGSGSDSRNRLLGDPIVADGKVFTIDTDADVSAFDAATGNRLWSVNVTPEHEEGGSVLGGGLAFDGGRVYATTGFAHVVALDAASGAEVWRTPVTAPMRAAPTVYGGRVFVVTLDNKGIALAASDGRILWTHSGVEEVAALLGAAAPAADNGVVIMPYTSGEVAALRAETGTPLWTDSVVATRRTDATGNLSDITARPVIDNNRLFIVGHSGLLVGIDMRTGNRVWELELAGLNQPWVAGNFLFLVTSDNQLVAVEADTGRVLWVRQLAMWTDPEDSRGRIMWTGPVLASDRLILTGSHGVAVTVSPYDGKILGRSELPQGVVLPPAIANETLYFLTDTADVVAYR